VCVVHEANATKSEVEAASELAAVSNLQHGESRGPSILSRAASGEAQQLR
jgi:hypothetical protein